MRASIGIGRIMGIPIALHASWFLVFTLVTASLASGYFPAEYPGWPVAVYWLVAAATAVMFFACVVFHELGHATVARRERVPVRGITLFIFGGIAQIEKEPPTAGAEFRIAIAGPIASAVAGGAFALLGMALGAVPVLAAPAVYLARINLTLAAFNLIPGFPLDGGRVLRAALWQIGGSYRRATRWTTTAGDVVAYAMILLGFVALFEGDLLNGLWIAFLGWFLHTAAEASYQQVVVREALAGISVGELMSRDCPTVPSSETLDRVIHDDILGAGRRCVLVADNGRLEGIVSLRDVRSIPRDRWPRAAAADAMTPLDRLVRARPDDPILAALERMDTAGVHQLPVMDDGHVLGILTREHVLSYVRTRGELGL